VLATVTIGSATVGGIKGSGTSEGAEAVRERCVGEGGQVFVIEPAP
jgi:hypothetical protein